MKNKNIFLIVGLSLIVIAVIVGVIVNLNKKPKEKTDGEKFSEEYTEVTKDNVFVYRNAEQIIKILENGTGIVYLGFPECPWCQRYTKYLNEVAKDMGIEKIYYYNIREDRQNNTEDYLKMVSLLEKHLQYDQEGNKRIYAPSIIALKKGEIVGFDDETAWDTKGFSKPDEYWTKEEVKDLKEKLEKMISDTEMNICVECK